jgi:hypothetical protein
VTGTVLVKVENVSIIPQYGALLRKNTHLK